MTLSGDLSWQQLARKNAPNASINICEYKLQIWLKYLNTLLVTSGFNMVSIPRKASAQSQSQSQSESRFKIEVNSYPTRGLIPNGTFGLTGLAWPQVPAKLIANLIQVIYYNTIDYARTQIDFLSPHKCSPKSHKRSPTIFAQMSWHLSQPQPNVSLESCRLQALLFGLPIQFLNWIAKENKYKRFIILKSKSS